MYCIQARRYPDRLLASTLTGCHVHLHRGVIIMFRSNIDRPGLSQSGCLYLIRAQSPRRCPCSVIQGRFSSAGTRRHERLPDPTYLADVSSCQITHLILTFPSECSVLLALWPAGYKSSSLVEADTKNIASLVCTRTGSRRTMCYTRHNGRDRADAYGCTANVPSSNIAPSL